MIHILIRIRNNLIIPEGNYFNETFCAFTHAGNDLEPGLSRASDKEPCAHHQPPHRRGPVHVIQHRWQPLRYHLQGQEGPTDGAALWKPAAGAAASLIITVFSVSGHLLKTNISTNKIF